MFTCRLRFSQARNARTEFYNSRKSTALAPCDSLAQRKYPLSNHYFDYKGTFAHPDMYWYVEQREQ